MLFAAKQRLFPILVLFVAPVGANADFRAALGPEFGFFLENTDGASSQALFTGGTISIISVEDDAFFGFFCGFSFIVPVKLTTNTEKIDLGFYDFVLQSELIIGPCFKFGITDELRLNLGAGLHALYLTASAKQNHEFYGEYKEQHQLFNLGAAAAVELNFDFSSPLYLAFGTAFTYDFCNYSYASAPSYNSGGWTQGYGLLGVKAYICVGWRFEDFGDD
ncbi:MAG: hypothetical protein LBG72_01725 [Spirochaetaceae bacterium]|jgi:hypothetical protein|nr:hypothetical protein [Spirochaetaceae bacterium]